MTGHSGPQGAGSNVRAVTDPAKLKAAFSTLSRAFTGGVGAQDAAAGGDDVRRRLWRAMRVLRDFDAPMLALIAVAPRADADRLIADLATSGVLASAGGCDDCPRHRLVADPGPGLPSLGARHG